MYYEENFQFQEDREEKSGIKTRAGERDMELERREMMNPFRSDG